MFNLFPEGNILFHLVIESFCMKLLAKIQNLWHNVCMVRKGKLVIFVQEFVEF